MTDRLYEAIDKSLKDFSRLPTEEKLETLKDIGILDEDGNVSEKYRLQDFEQQFSKFLNMHHETLDYEGIEALVDAADNLGRMWSIDDEPFVYDSVGEAFLEFIEDYELDETITLKLMAVRGSVGDLDERLRNDLEYEAQEEFDDDAAYYEEQNVYYVAAVDIAFVFGYVWNPKEKRFVTIEEIAK